MTNAPFILSFRLFFYSVLLPALDRDKILWPLHMIHFVHPCPAVPWLSHAPVHTLIHSFDVEDLQVSK